MFSTPIFALLIKESSREILGTLVFWASLSFVSYSSVWAKSTANCFPNKIFNIEVLQASPCCTHLSGAYHTSGFLRLRVPLHAFCTHRLWLPNHHFTVTSVKSPPEQIVSTVFKISPLLFSQQIPWLFINIGQICHQDNRDWLWIKMSCAIEHD